ncbi:FIST N-terminal domain-containing protein [Paracoccus solventivorans]|uniref:FIST N-terminal domain-containing protein n=1 Tax=Paracoccus solventivorans TaxID=53463 RepID=UPI002D1FC1B3|nr:FIST N-terminal domain-containing protein [Paracoccus solventivorans]
MAQTSLDDAGPGGGPGGSQAPVALSVAAEDAAGADTLVAGLAECDPALVLLFGSPRAALGPIAQRLGDRLAGVRIAGCSSAGEIGAAGYQRDTVVAVGFPRSSFRVGAVALRNQRLIPVSAWLSQLRQLRDEFPPRAGWSQFGILLADGSASQEDVLVTALDAALPDVPVVGGSAGEGVDFGQSCQILDGAVIPGAAIFVLVETSLAVSEVSFAHFTPTEKRAVVTSADPGGRVIHELNAEPAAQEYARLAGLDPARLDRADFARHPLLLKTGRRHHVRAISGVGQGGALQLMSAVETGSGLALGQAGDVTAGFADTLDALPRLPLMVLGFDCILRRLAVEQAGMTGAMAELFDRYRIFGFNTFGEQLGAMHVNQTFVGLALMEPDPAA